MKRFFTALATAMALVAVAPAAPAEAVGGVETWDWVEVRVPLTDGQYGLPHQLRVFLDGRFGNRYQGGNANGMGQLFARVGPIWELHPNMFLGVHYTTYVNQFDPEGQPGAFEVVQRPEIEPNFRGRLGDFTWNDRNRFEYASSPRYNFFRYRNQLRVNYQPAGWRTFPYVWDEAMFQLDRGFNQNRASVGVAHQLTDQTRLDVGYILRSRAAGAGPWENDHVFNVYLFFAPRVPSLFPQQEIPGGAGS